MSTVAGLQTGIEQAQAILAADGSNLEVVEQTDTAVRFRLDFEDAECADCVLPVSHLTTVIAGVMQDATGNPQFTVEIDDPRVAS